MDKLREWCKKKLTRNNMIILALSGVLIMILAIPTEKKEKEQTSLMQSGQWDTKSDTLQAEEMQEEQTEEQLERRLEQFLSCMDGVGKAKVMLTFAAGRERVVEKDTPYSQSQTSENDASGISRVVTTHDQQEDTVYFTDSEGNQSPYVTRTLAAQVEGVTVLAQGGDSAVVQEEITDMMVVLFGIEPHKIKVAKLGGVSQDETAGAGNY